MFLKWILTIGVQSLSTSYCFGQQSESMSSFDVQKQLTKIDPFGRKLFLKIWTRSALDFGLGLAGDSAKTISPGKHESPENGSFFIWGLPFKKFDILLPERATLKHVRARASDRKYIYVSQFKSYPSFELRLSALGTRKIYIGATRSALAKDLRSGDYEGWYLLTLISH